MLLWGAAGLGMSLSSVLTGCIRSRVRGVGLKFQSGMTWARLILIAAAKEAYLAFLSQSFPLSASSCLLLNILRASSRSSLWGESQGPFLAGAVFGEYQGLIGLRTGHVGTEVQRAWKYLD